MLFEKGIQGLLQRICGKHADKFRYEWLDKEDGKDVWQLHYAKPYIMLCGNTPVSMAVALHHYLKDDLHLHFSWCGNRVDFPETLPKPKDTKKHVILQEHRVNLNYCTFNYTAAWWEWDRWEQEIDFMALNGVNNPLAMVGQEGVWYKMLLKFDFTDEEARAFLTGPAYFAWEWMTNIQSFGGPVSKEYLQKRIALGQKIISRYRELGMEPIQQGFSGFVPTQTTQKFPDASIITKPGWCNFPETAQLDPLDPLFREMGLEFMKCQEELFGTSHFYGVDPFHEGEPPCDTAEYLHNVGKQICHVLEEADPDYIWVMQAWSIRKDIITAAPKVHMLVLDLNGASYSRNESFWGYPFVLGELHNFGGRTNLHGDLCHCAEFSYQDMKTQYPNLVGRGVFMESMIQNPAYYDLLYGTLTEPASTDIHSWKKHYIMRRYGTCTDNILRAWEILLNTVYARGTNDVESSSIVCARPAIHVKKSGPNTGFQNNYSNKDLLQAVELLWKDRDLAGNSDGYRYDIVDFMRQVLSNYGQAVHKCTVKAWEHRNPEQFADAKTEFLTLLHDIDRLTASRDELRFEKWLTDARKSACTEDDRVLFEKNASMLLTIWGPEDAPEIFDYAWREWSGLIEQYYKMRWEFFYEMLEQCLIEGKDYNEEGLPQIYERECFKANDFYQEMAAKERTWINQRNKTGFAPKTNELEQSEKSLARYSTRILEDKDGMLKTDLDYINIAFENGIED